MILPVDRKPLPPVHPTSGEVPVRWRQGYAGKSSGLGVLAERVAEPL